MRCRKVGHVKSHLEAKLFEYIYYAALQSDEGGSSWAFLTFGGQLFVYLWKTMPWL